MDKLVNVNDVIEMLNNIDRYVSDSLMLESNNKIFPSNEVFIVDDVYEGLETIPSLNRWISCLEKMPKEGVFHRIMMFLLRGEMKKKRGDKM